MIALITGANRGIGAELALGLAAQGWSVGLLGRDLGALGAVAARCREASTAAGAAGVAVATADVTDRAAVSAAVDSVLTELAGELGGLDLLVNNAGVIESVEAPFGETDVEESWRVVEVNVRGPLLVTAAALPSLLDGAGGHVVNLNSGAGHRPYPAYTGYAMSKGALARFTTQLDAQYRDQGLRVFDVVPGHVATDMTTSMPMHDGRVSWTPASAVVDLVAAIGAGRLDELAGRLFRAGTDTVESLLAQAELIVARNARVLRLAPIDDDDPVA